MVELSKSEGVTEFIARIYDFLITFLSSIHGVSFSGMKSILISINQSSEWSCKHLICSRAWNTFPLLKNSFSTLVIFLVSSTSNGSTLNVNEHVRKLLIKLIKQWNNFIPQFWVLLRTGNEIKRTFSIFLGGNKKKEEKKRRGKLCGWESFVKVK